MLLSDWPTGRGPAGGQAGSEGRGPGHQDEGAGAAAEGGESGLIGRSISGCEGPESACESRLGLIGEPFRSVRQLQL